MIELAGAAARAGGAQLWSGVNLSLRQGEFLAVLGPNGAGKSTLVKILLGVAPPSGGTVRVFGGSPGRANISSVTCRSGAASTAVCASGARTS